MRRSMRVQSISVVVRAIAGSVVLWACGSCPQSLQCDMHGYKQTSGLTASLATNDLTIAWKGEKDEELRMRMAIENGTPTIRELAMRRQGVSWIVLAKDLTPDLRIVAG